MLKVHCPANLLWHPSLHHSLLLLRGLRQPHTFFLESPVSLAESHGSRLAFPLVADSSIHINTSRDNAPPLERVTAPQHIPWMLALSSPTEQQLESLRKDMPAYLEASVVSTHLLAKTDALLVALHSGEMETIRQTHAALMDSVAQLDDTLRDDKNSSSTGLSSESGNAEEPLSTWPLYTSLQFLIEQGGLLTSAYPRVLAAYTRLSKERAVGHHNRLLQRTVDGSAPEIKEQASLEYSAKGFLVEVQRDLAEYTTSREERMANGVTGDKGPLRSRVSGGRMGLQTVPARMPWTIEQIPFQRRH